ncbi:MAG TPA: DUF2207 domain-containing protein, partial [Oceanithermus sp.]|nr:DUF2207 domain-containing protein [Oceanithermus sp.]
FRSLRVYLGDPARYVPRGRHVYALRYRVEGAVRPGPELLWNVTGNDWAFPVELAEVSLATPVTPTTLAAYVGAYGSRERVPVQEEGGVYRARVRNLAPGTGLTLHARFPPGSLPETAGGDPAGLPLLALAAGLLAFYLLAWNRLGRDPRGPPRIPRFHPPEGVSAPLARLLVFGAKDDRTFLAGVLDLARRGHLLLDRIPGGYRLVRREPEHEALPPELTALAGALFQNRRAVSLDRQEAGRLRSARAALQNALALRERAYRKANGTPFWAGTLLVALVLALLAYYAGAGSFGLAAFAALCAVFTAVFGQVALARAALALEAYRRVPGLGPLGPLLGAAFSLLAFLTLPLPAALVTFFLVGPPAALAVYLLLALNGLFGYLLPAYTPEGVRTRNHLLGLARYLAVTDEAELRRIGAPEDTPAHLEALFPYAVALGLEAPLARRLTRALARAEEGEDAGRAPVLTWYRGPGLARADAASLARVPTLLTRDLTRGLLAAYHRAVAPGSGGSSRGGVGGGGGGGW